MSKKDETGKRTYFSEVTPATYKQRKFVKQLAKTGEIGTSAELAGFERSYGSKLMRSNKILTLLHQELEKQGVDNDLVVGRLKEGLDAYYVKKDGGKRYKDFHAIFKYLDMYMKLGGHYAPEKHEVIKREEKVNITFSPEFMEALLDSKALTPEEADEVREDLKREYLEQEKEKGNIIDATIVEDDPVADKEVDNRATVLEPEDNPQEEDDNKGE